MRKMGESVWVGDNVKITVLDIDRGKIRLAFDAPPEVSIDRAEIRAAKRRGEHAPGESVNVVAPKEDVP